MFRMSRVFPRLGATAIAVSLAVPVLSQTPAPARQLGTVKASSGSTLTVAGDKGDAVSVNLSDSTKVLQLAPGSTDLKTATPATAADISVGDRVLAVGAAGDGGAIAATRVVLMKSGDIEQQRAAQQADWQRRGSGGLVSAVSGSEITIKQGQRNVTITTTPKTIFRRYASDSVKFEDSKAGTLGDIKPGDQLRVRGEKSADGSSIAADEVISGAFRNLAGTVASIDVANNKLVLKDLESKKNVTVTLAQHSDFRSLPPQMATMLAARARGGAGATGGAPAARPSTDAAPAGGSAQGGFRREGGAPGQGGPGGPRGGGDLSSMLSRLPVGQLSTLKTGDALMVVGTGSGSDAVTAITMLSGVEPILTAPNGASSITLAPWNMGGGGGGGDAQ